MAIKKSPTTITPMTLLLMVVAILVIAYILVNTAANKTPATPESQLQDRQDLSGELDALETINVDSVDSGLNELSAEVSRY